MQQARDVEMDKGKDEQKMRAIVQSQYGSPEVLRMEMVDRPQLSEDGVEVRIQAAAINAGDWHLMRGEPFFIRLLFGGVLRPKIRTLGFDISGRVEAVGTKVSRFRPGDEVFGDLSTSGFGAFAEYACAKESALAEKPAAISFEEAASVPGAGLAALQGLREADGLRAGQRVLILGASGGVGSFAVQLAKIHGADVTAVCREDKRKQVSRLGADRILDADEEDFAKSGPRYDAILDAAAFHSPRRYLPALEPNGTYVLIGGSTGRFMQVMLFGPLLSLLNRRRLKCLASKPNQADLLRLRDLLEEGRLVPQIDRSYELSEVPDAIRRLEARQACGKIVIRVG